MKDETLILSYSGRLENKVAAIKALRTLTCLGLKEAKEMVEAVADDHKTKITSLDLHENGNLNEALDTLRRSGINAKVTGSNNPARNAIAEELQKLVTMATLAAQYDLSHSILNILETQLHGLPKKEEDDAVG